MPDHINSQANTKPLGLQPNDRSFSHDIINPIAESAQRISDNAERAREHAPTIIELNKLSGVSTTNIYQTTQRLRIKYLIFQITNSAFDRYQIFFGSRSFTFSLAQGVTPLEFPYEVDRGTDIYVSDITSDTHQFGIQIVAYTE